jgi:F-type H+-transporting ATPase subunit beta
VPPARPPTRILVARARKLQRFLTQPFFVAAAYTGMEGRSVATADTVAGCRAILEGECDDWEEGAFYMIGTLDEAREKAARGQGATKKPSPAPAAPATEAPRRPAKGAR